MPLQLSRAGRLGGEVTVTSREADATVVEGSPPARAGLSISFLHRMIQGRISVCQLKIRYLHVVFPAANASRARPANAWWRSYEK